MTKRVLVCGGRAFGLVVPERNFIFNFLDNLFLTRGWILGEPDNNWLPDVHIISGEAQGVDSLARDYAVINWTDYSGFPADWGRYGKRAGFVRNTQMLEEGKPDLVVAFPGGKGTAMMASLARKAGVEVIEVKYE